MLYDTKNSRNEKGDKPSVAVIGGGIAGLSCAAELQQVYDVTVYDTGRLRPGGRASSRQPQDPLKEDDPSNMYPILSKYRYDHAAQFLSCGTSRTNWRREFDHQLHAWVEEGLLQAVPSEQMFLLEKNGDSWKIDAFLANSDQTTTTKAEFYYPSQGMSSFAQALMKEGSFRVEQDVWVSPSSGVRYLSSKTSQKFPGKWQVRAQGRVLGEFNHLVIAHNGKCADRLMSQTPAKDVHQLLRVNFSDRVPPNGGQKMTLNSLYSLTIALKSPSPLAKALPEPFLGGFVQGHPKLSMITCQTKKYPTSTYGNNDEKDVEVWNILSTASFAKRNKAPQEFLPEEVVANVTRQLVEALEEIVESDKNASPLLDQVVDSRVQLWGAAVPMNVWVGRGHDNNQGSGFIYDPEFQVGVCGDWLLEPSIAGAWTSGRHLAQYLKKVQQLSDEENETNPKDGAQNESIGLIGQFKASPGVRKLGIASLDGPMNQSKQDQNVTPDRSNPVRTRNNKNNGSRKGSNNGQRSQPSPKKDRTPVATIDSTSS
jgi:predicted NAD/FAD-dependent oxidoreductase